MKLPRPEYMDAFSWFDALRATLVNGMIPIMQKEDDWRDIASFIHSYTLFKGKVPLANQFQDWRSWAIAFYNNIGG